MKMCARRRFDRGGRFRPRARERERETKARAYENERLREQKKHHQTHANANNKISFVIEHHPASYTGTLKKRKPFVVILSLPVRTTRDDVERRHVDKVLRNFTFSPR